MEVVDYKVISESSREKLTESVQQAINEGWQPWHGLSMVDSGSSRHYAQAVVQYSQKPKYLQPSRN